jgi:anti-sigma factor RsiW
MRLTPRHIPFERLADMAEGRLSADESREEREHLSACEQCSTRAAELGRVVSLMRADDTEDAPAHALASAVRMFRARPSAERAQSLVSRIVAALTFDSAALTPAFGIRSGQAAPARQLLFSAGDFDVDLRLAQGGEGWTVSGQVLGPCEGGSVELTLGGSEDSAQRATLNDSCEFTLPPVAEGVYALRLSFGETEVEIPDLSLTA